MNNDITQKEVDALFYLRCLAMIHRDFVEYSYISPHKGSILTGIAESVKKAGPQSQSFLQSASRLLDLGLSNQKLYLTA